MNHDILSLQLAQEGTKPKLSTDRRDCIGSKAKTLFTNSTAALNIVSKGQVYSKITSPTHTTYMYNLSQEGEFERT